MNQPPPDTPRPEDQTPLGPTVDHVPSPLAPNVPKSTESQATPGTADQHKVGSIESFLLGSGSQAQPAESDPHITRAFGEGSSSSTTAVLPPDGGRSRYAKLRPLGKGGLGEVFVAMDKEVNREVALKEIHERHSDNHDSRIRFLLEAEVTGRLEHPGVVPVYGLGRHRDGRPYYAMRLIKGEMLKDAILRFRDADKPGRDPGERSLAFRELLRRFIDVCNALAYAHSKGVLHRDLKPDNVMLGPFGETLVIDWGLAKVLGRPVGESAQGVALLQGMETALPSGTGIAGTPGYMSPEQSEGTTNELTPASDIYSLGAILYTLLTGQPPFKKASLEMLLLWTREGTFAPPRKIKTSVPPALEAVCLKAMALRPEDRYASVKDLAADVDHWLADEPVTAYRDPWLSRVRRWARRHRSLVSGVAALMVTLTAALGVGLALVNAEKNRTAEARDRERHAKEAEQKANDALRVSLERETKLKGDLQVSLTRSQKAEKSATEQRQLALKTMRGLRNDIDAELKDKPNLQDLRKKLLRRDQDGLRKVAQAADTAPGIDQETIWVHFELGDISLTVDGAVREAKKEYEAAHALAKQRTVVAPTDLEAQRDLAISHAHLGDVELRVGHSKEALGEYQAALQTNWRIAGAEPHNTQAQRDLWVSTIKMGDVQLQVSRTKESLESYQAALNLANNVDKVMRDGTGGQRDLAVVYERLGDAQLQWGNTREAGEAYQTALTINRVLADQHKDNAPAQRSLAVAYNKVGRLQMQIGKTKEAVDSYHAGLKISKTLADADLRNAQAQRDLALAYQTVGDVEFRLGHPKEALTAYQATLPISQKLAYDAKDDSQAQRDLAVAYNKLGDVQFQTEDMRGALAAFRAAVPITKQLADNEPDNPQAQRDLAVLHDRLGDVQVRLDDLQGALATYRAALDICKKLVDPHFGSTEAQRDLMISRNKVGGVLLELRDTKGALQAYEASLQVCKELSNLAPDNAQAQRDLGLAYNNQADVYLQMGEPRKAVEAYKAGLAISHKLADADRSNAVAQHDLLVSFFKLGDVDQKTGEFRTATDWFVQALGVPRRIDKPDFFAADVRKIQGRLRVCRAAGPVLADIKALEKVPPADRGIVLDAVINVHVRRKQPDRALAAADQLAKDTGNPDSLYNAACGYARCIALVDNPDVKDRYAARGIELLTQAVARGYRDAATMRKDSDLDGLRPRAAFKTLLRELERKKP